MLITNAGKFKREDLARALLNYVVLDVIQLVQLVSSLHGIKRVFFCGGVSSSPLVRRLITTEYVRRNLYMLSFGLVICHTLLFFLAVHACSRLNFVTSILLAITN